MLASAQDVENAPQLRSRSFEGLDVPTEYASLFKFSAALLNDHFEYPENSTPIVSDSSFGAGALLVHP